METIGHRIRQRRDDRELSLPRLAEEAGVAKGYLWELENDQAGRPSASTLFKIATALGTTVADLLGQEPQKVSKGRVPPSLRAFAREEGLTEDDVQMLAGIQYRGQRPKTREDWKFLLESIRRSVQRPARRRVSQALHHARNRRTWATSEAQLLMKETGIADPVEAIRSKATELIVGAELNGPPTDLSLLASIRGILSIDAVEMREAGRLVPTPDGLVVQTNEADSAGRQRFTIAHEIVHTLIPGFSRRPALRVDANVGNFARSDEEEYLCDVGGSALVLPEAWLRPRAVELGPSLAGVFQLADEFECSLEATGLAWVQLQIWPCAIAIWERALKPSEVRRLRQPTLPEFKDMKQEPTPKFRIARFFRSEEFPYFIPRHKSADDNSVIGQAAEWSTASGTLSLTLGDQLVTMKCEAEFAPFKRSSDDVERVIALLIP